MSLLPAKTLLCVISLTTVNLFFRKKTVRPLFQMTLIYKELLCYMFSLLKQSPGFLIFRVFQRFVASLGDD